MSEPCISCNRPIFINNFYPLEFCDSCGWPVCHKCIQRLEDKEADYQEVICPGCYEAYLESWVNFEGLEGVSHE